MKKLLGPLIMTVIWLTGYNLTWGQDSISFTSENLIGGTWRVCTDMKFSNNFQCDKGYTAYEFLKTGIFKDNRQPFYYPKQYSFVSGKWTLIGNTLTMDEDDDQYHQAFPKIKNIYWLDKDRFYYTGQEGKDGPTVYTYFQRTK